jgi:hypothetical protein
VQSAKARQKIRKSNCEMENSVLRDNDIQHLPLLAVVVCTDVPIIAKDICSIQRLVN